MGLRLKILLCLQDRTPNFIVYMLHSMTPMNFMNVVKKIIKCQLNIVTSETMAANHRES